MKSNYLEEAERLLLLEWISDMNEAVQIADVGGRLVFANDILCKRLGYNKDELLAMKVADIDLDLKNLDNWRAKLEYLKVVSSVVVQVNYLRKNGTRFSVEVNCRYAEINGKGYVTAVSVDIAEREKKEKILARSEALFNEIMNNSTEAIFLVDSFSNAILDCNQRAVGLFGFLGKSQMVGMRGHMLQKRTISDIEIEKILAQIREKGTWEAETEFVSRDGREFWCSFSATVLKVENETPYFLVRLIDIDNKKRAEESLMRSEKRYKDLVHYNQTLICTHDMEGNILTVNPACLKSLSYQSEDELVGHNLQMLFDQKNLEGYHEYLRQINNIGMSQGVMQVLSKEGKKMFWVYRNYKVEEAGLTPYVVGSAQDITDRVMIERELKKAKIVAEKSLRTRELFLANVSHEVRTPLHGIMGVTNLLINTGLSDEQSNYLKIVRHSAESLLVIMNDILDIAKMESGKLELETIPFDLYDTILSSVKPLSLKAADKGLEFKTKLPKVKIPYLIGDPHRLSQIILNLANNAIKFTEKGSIGLSLEILHDINNVLTVEINVTDTGIGIAEEKLDKIFEEFSQADASHTRLYGGTGLGLSICKKLVELQKGSIYANSTKGKGSEFGFILHFQKAAPNFEPVEEKTEVDYEQFKGVRILLAEDNAINQLIAKTILEMKGVLVDVADCGTAALTLFKQNKYDLILMDIQMPDMDGDQVTAYIRQYSDPQKASVPIIALTANAMKGDNEKQIMAGMDGYLSKPYNDVELFQKIAVHLNFSLNKKNEVAKQKDEKTGNNRTAPLYDISELQEIFGDDGSVAILLRAFLDTTPPELAAIRLHLANADIVGVKNSIHKMRPSLLQMKNANLAKCLESIKDKISTEHSSDLEEEVLKLVSIVEEMMEEMERDPILN